MDRLKRSFNKLKCIELIDLNFKFLWRNLLLYDDTSLSLEYDDHVWIRYNLLMCHIVLIC
jgi:hypothetical protein